MVHLHWFFKQIRHYTTVLYKTSPIDILGIILILTIPAIEVVSIYNNFASKIGTICWVLLWAYIALFTLQQLIELIKTSLRHRSPFALLTIGLFLFLCVTNIQSIYSINGENTQEISCTLSQLTNSKDWGYRQACLFGYPTRQFIVPALPSLIFGNSLSMLNIGGAIYFILGLILFCRGIQIYGEDYRKNDILILLLLSSLLHFHYVNHFLFLFEQSIFPLSFALAMSGIWLLYIRTKNITLLVPFTLMIFVVTFAYTPSLALVPLAYGLILAQMIQAKSTRFRALGVFIVIISALLVLSSFQYRSDIKFGQQYPGGMRTAIVDMSLAIKHLAIHIYPTPFTTWIFTPIFFAIVLLPLLGLFGLPAQIIVAWCIFVFFASMYAKGYTYYHVEFRMHRIMVFLPVLCALWAHILNSYRKHIPLVMIIVVAFGMTLSGLQNYKATQLARPISQQYKFIQWLKLQNIPLRTTLYLLDAATAKNNFVSIRDISQYFTPELAVNNQLKLSADCSVATIYGIFLIPETSRCSQSIRQKLGNDPALSYVARYTVIADEPLLIFSRKLEP